MFLFFFENLNDNSVINDAFNNICRNKMLYDGYFDMSVYIYARIKKEEILSKLISSKSKYATLYKNSYPTKDNAVELWNQFLQNITGYYVELSHIESEAVVNWIYRAFKDASEREEFTKELFKSMKDLYVIRNNIQFSRGIVYNK